MPQTRGRTNRLGRRSRLTAGALATVVGVSEKASRESKPSPPADTPPLRTTDDGVLMPVRVIPRATRTLLADWRDGRLLVRLTAAPVEGAANAALIRLLAKELRVRRGAVRIVTGERAREKSVLFEGVTAEQLLDRLTKLVPPVS